MRHFIVVGIVATALGGCAAIREHWQYPEGYEPARDLTLRDLNWSIAARITFDGDQVSSDEQGRFVITDTQGDRCVAEVKRNRFSCNGLPPIPFNDNLPMGDAQ